MHSLAHCVSDDLIFTHGNLLTKTDVFDKIKDGKMDKHMRVNDLCIRKNGDTAVITYRCETAYTDNNVMEMELCGLQYIFFAIIVGNLSQHIKAS